MATEVFGQKLLQPEPCFMHLSSGGAEKANHVGWLEGSSFIYVHPRQTPGFLEASSYVEPDRMAWNQALQTLRSECWS